MKKLIFCLFLGRHDEETLEIDRPDYYGNGFLSRCDRCR